MKESRLEGFFDVSDNRGGGDYTVVERVVRLKGEILARNDLYNKMYTKITLNSQKF